MRGDFFTYQPRFLLILSGNHRPHLGAIDEGIPRRLHLVPFDQHIPAAERDPKLPDKLREEWPAILAWAVAGCLRWQREGLCPPAAVTGATGEYLEGEDLIGNWLDAATDADMHGFESSGALFADYAAWCTKAGERPMSMRRLISTLQDRGLVKDRTNTAKGFRGRTLKPAYASRLGTVPSDEPQRQQCHKCRNVPVSLFQPFACAHVYGGNKRSGTFRHECLYRAQARAAPRLSRVLPSPCR